MIRAEQSCSHQAHWPHTCEERVAYYAKQSDSVQSCGVPICNKLCTTNGNCVTRYARGLRCTHRSPRSFPKNKNIFLPTNSFTCKGAPVLAQSKYEDELEVDQEIQVRQCTLCCTQRGPRSILKYKNIFLPTTSFTCKGAPVLAQTEQQDRYNIWSGTFVQSNFALIDVGVFVFECECGYIFIAGSHRDIWMVFTVRKMQWLHQ